MSGWQWVLVAALICACFLAMGLLCSRYCKTKKKKRSAAFGGLESDDEIPHLVPMDLGSATMFPSQVVAPQYVAYEPIQAEEPVIPGNATKFPSQAVVPQYAAYAPMRTNSYAAYAPIQAAFPMSPWNATMLPSQAVPPQYAAYAPNQVAAGTNVPGSIQPLPASRIWIDAQGSRS
jgi:hypothetical protein